MGPGLGRRAAAAAAPRRRGSSERDRGEVVPGGGSFSKCLPLEIVSSPVTRVRPRSSRAGVVPDEVDVVPCRETESGTELSTRRVRLCEHGKQAELYESGEDADRRAGR